MATGRCRRMLLPLASLLLSAAALTSLGSVLPSRIVEARYLEYSVHPFDTPTALVVSLAPPVAALALSLRRVAPRWAPLAAGAASALGVALAYAGIRVGLLAPAAASLWLLALAARESPSEALWGALLALAVPTASSLVAAVARSPDGLREAVWWAWGPVEWASVSLLLAAGLIGAAEVALLRKVDLYPWGLSRPRAPPHPRALLAASVALAWLLPLVPRLSSPSPWESVVSVDTRYYLGFLEAAEREGLGEALARFGRMARPVLLCLLYAASRALHSKLLLVDYLCHAVGLTGLALASYYAARRLWGEAVAPYAALLAASGPHALVFVVAGYQANELALPMALAALAAPLPAAAALMVFVNLFHPWTFYAYSAALVMRWARERGAGGAVLAALSLLPAAVLGELVNSQLHSTTPLRAVALTLAPSLGREVFPANFSRGLAFWAWGYYSHPTASILAALGAQTHCLAYYFLVIAALMSLAGLPSVLVHRMLVEAPLEATAARALAVLPPRLALGLAALHALYTATTLLLIGPTH